MSAAYQMNTNEHRLIKGAAQKSNGMLPTQCQQIAELLFLS